MTEGEFRRVELRRYRIAGQAVMPRLPLELSPRRYDAVVKSLNGKLMLPAVYLASHARGVPFVLWTGMWHHPRTRVHTLSRPLTEHIYRRAEAIVAYGEHVKRFLAETAAIEPGKVFVAGQAVRAEPFEAVEPSRHGSAEVLFVGQFEERKGLAHLVDAFASQPDLQAKLRLVGNGSLEPQMTLRAAQDPRVELVGYVPQERLPAELARSRCLVLPSITTDLDREPWGLVINEAMHAGVPVVTTDGVRAAAGGLVEDGRNGFVVPEGMRRRSHVQSAVSSAIRRLPRGSATRRARTCDGSAIGPWPTPSRRQSSTRAPLRRLVAERFLARASISSGCGSVSSRYATASAVRTLRPQDRGRAVG